MKTPKLVTREFLVEQIAKHGAERIIGRCLVEIYKRQTDEEKSTEQTRFNNGIGFSGVDARVGSIAALYYMHHNTLQPWMVKVWSKVTSTGFPKICKYSNQLNQIANAKKQTV